MAKLPRLVDKLGLEWRQPERVGRKDRRIKRMPLNEMSFGCALLHFPQLAPP